MGNTSIFLRLMAVVLLIGVFASKASATQWVPVEGRVMFNNSPLCAMVLANGQNTFSCGGDGSYQLSVPLASNGQITLFSFASGFAPFKHILTPQEAGNFVVDMERESDGRMLALKSFLNAQEDNRVVVTGTVEYDGYPVCAMVLANGQHVFSCGDNLGKYHLETIKDSLENLTLSAFASGFQPFRETFSLIPPTALNDTGIIDCADNDNNDLMCPVDPFPGQDAEYGRDSTHSDNSNGHAGFSFSRICNSGELAGEGKCPKAPDLGAGVNDWACTKDNVTGLIWEVKTDDGGLRDKNNSYVEGYVQAVRDQRLCGANNWRMPTIKELENIAHRGRYNPSIDTDYFPNTVSWYYLSGSLGTDCCGQITQWGVHFADGHSMAGVGEMVRLVHSKH